MNTIKTTCTKINFGVTIVGSFFILLSLSNCKQKKAQSTNPQSSSDLVTPSRTKEKASIPQVTPRKSYPQKSPAGQHFYLTKNYPKASLEKIKQKELNTWRKQINQEFSIDFKTKHTLKYFNVAYRCSEEQINFLMYTLKIFFQQMYPVYFKYEPTHPFQIIYFATKKEYSRYTGSEAYGFYSPKTKTLYTYANSGEGTLWHELIHAFVDANIDHQVQQWFSEGFASFYEMGAVYNKKFYEGYTNWRHPALKKKIRQKDFLPLTAFLQEKYMSEGYGYAKARFLFCYLWVHNQMPSFVKTYLYELSGKYQGIELGKQAIQSMEKLLNKSMVAIEKDYKSIALKYGKFKKLKKVK